MFSFIKSKSSKMDLSHFASKYFIFPATAHTHLRVGPGNNENHISCSGDDGHSDDRTSPDESDV